MCPIRPYFQVEAISDIPVLTFTGGARNKLRLLNIPEFELFRSLNNREVSRTYCAFYGNSLTESVVSISFVTGNYWGTKLGNKGKQRTRTLRINPSHCLHVP